MVATPPSPPRTVPRSALSLLPAAGIVLAVLALVWFTGAVLVRPQDPIWMRALLTAFDFIAWLLTWMAAAALGWWLAPAALRLRHLGLLLIIAVGLNIMRLLLAAPFADFFGIHPMLILATRLPWHLLVISMVIAGGAAARMIIRERAQAADLSELQRELAYTELRNLREAVEPELLVRSLAAVEERIAHAPRAADAHLMEVSQLLRLQLRRWGRPLVSLGEEMEYAQLAARMRGQLREAVPELSWQVPGNIRDALLPADVLGMLVSLAGEHADSAGEEVAAVRVAAERSGGRLRLTAAPVHSGTARDHPPPDAERLLAAILREHYPGDYELVRRYAEADRPVYVLEVPLALAGKPAAAAGA
jgi:hypothetical protein